MKRIEKMATRYDYELKDRLITKYVKVSLSDVFSYTTTTTLNGVQIHITVGYNTFNKQRWVFIKDDGNNILLPQTFLKYGRRCELNFNAELNNLSYYVTLKPKSMSNVLNLVENYDYEYWSEYFDLCFVGFEYELIEKLNTNNFLYLVGQL